MFLVVEQKNLRNKMISTMINDHEKKIHEIIKSIFKLQCTKII